MMLLNDFYNSNKILIQTNFIGQSYGRTFNRLIDYQKKVNLPSLIYGRTINNSVKFITPLE